MSDRAALRGLAAGLVMALAAAPAPAETGAAAFARGARAEAVALWTEEAAQGSLDAKLQLGLAYDLGLGVESDKTRALLWYLEAAEAGHPDGQFNVGVMLDAGLGTGLRNLAAASVWYARAAANGHPRGQYNLALLYQAGEGVPRNPDLARYWFEQAAQELPAAAAKLAALPASGALPRALDAPEIRAGELVELAGWSFAELVWTAPPGPPEAEFLVEIVAQNAAGDAWTAPIVSERTHASALTADLQDQGMAFAWRVVQVASDGSRYVSSGWSRLGASTLDLPEDAEPAGLHATNAPAERVAHEVIDALSD